MNVAIATVTFRGESWGIVIAQMAMYLLLIAAVVFAGNRYRKRRDRGR